MVISTATPLGANANDASTSTPSPLSLPPRKIISSLNQPPSLLFPDHATVPRSSAPSPPSMPLTAAQRRRPGAPANHSPHLILHTSLATCVDETGSKVAQNASSVPVASALLNPVDDRGLTRPVLSGHDRAHEHVLTGCSIYVDVERQSPGEESWQGGQQSTLHSQAYVPLSRPPLQFGSSKPKGDRLPKGFGPSETKGGQHFDGDKGTPENHVSPSLKKPSSGRVKNWLGCFA